jgi:outer membrane protein TolC
MNKCPIYWNKLLLQIFCLAVLHSATKAQNNSILNAPENKQFFTLQEVVSLAKIQSPLAIQAKSKFRNSYWSYNIFLISKLPSVSLNAQPTYQQSINKQFNILTNDYDFLPSNSLSSSTNLVINQNVLLTGGSISLSSGLQTLNNYGGTASPPSYLSNPLQLGFVQPLFTYNPFKWSTRIEPLRYLEAKKQYLEDMENVAEQAGTFFFDLLNAQAGYKIAQNNKWNNDTLLAISKGRFNIGMIAENELLQMELNTLNSENAVAQSELDIKTRTFKLKSFLGIKDESDIELTVNPSTNFFKVDLKQAQTLAFENRPSIIDYQIQLTQASRDLERAKKENRFAVNLTGSYGFSQSSTTTIENAYYDPIPQQLVSVGFQVPIIDWGLARSRIKIALANQELTKTNVEQAQADFEQDIFLKVTQFNMQQRQLFIASKADTVAQKRFQITKYRYTIGKIDIQTLSIAQNEKDMARRSYIEALRSYWTNFFEIRKITLYDFEAGKPIDINFEDLLK